MFTNYFRIVSHSDEISRPSNNFIFLTILQIPLGNLWNIDTLQKIWRLKDVLGEKLNIVVNLEQNNSKK